MPVEAATTERKEGEARVGSVANAIAILRFLAQRDSPLGVNAIAREVGLNQSSCFNILRTLVAERFVEFDPADKRYSLGFGSIELARRALDPANAFDIARPLIERMARRDDLTIGLWRLTDHPQRLLLVGHCESGAPMHIRLANGHRIPRLAGSMGPLVAAALDLSDNEIAREFDRLLWEASPGLDGFLASVEQAPWQRLGARFRPLCAGGRDARGAVVRRWRAALRALAHHVQRTGAGGELRAAGARARARDRAPPVRARTRRSHGGGMMRFTPIATGYKFLEAGRVAEDGALFFSDYGRGGVYRLDTAGDRRCWLANVRGIGGMAFNDDGQLLVSAIDGLWLLDLDADERAPVPLETGGARNFNDIEADGAGGFYVGTIDLAARAQRLPPAYGELLHVTRDGGCTTVGSGIGAANGIGVDPLHRSLYLSDTGAGIWRFPLHAPGVVGERELLYEMTDSDGLTVDADGNVWVAAWETGSVVRIDPASRSATRYPLPGGQAMTLAFGGADGRELYVFGGSDVLDPEAPAKASIYHANTGNAGVPPAKTSVRLPAISPAARSA